jgi:hypothetical protein
MATGPARPFIGGSEHHRHRRPVNVCVEQANLVTEPAETCRQIGRHRRFTYPSLAARHRDDVASAIDPYLAGLGAQFGLDLVYCELDFGCAEVVRQHRMDPRGDFPQRLLPVAGIAQHHRPTASFGRLHFFHQAQTHDIGRVAWVIHAAERRQNLISS